MSKSKGKGKGKGKDQGQDRSKGPGQDKGKVKNRKSPLAWAIAAAALVVLAVVGGLYFFREKPLPPPKPSDRPSSPRSLGRFSPPDENDLALAQSTGKYTVVLDTSAGTIQLELYGDLMPLTVANFVKLAKAGFYDGLTFHRVEDWVIQGGDPAGNGTGGPGYQIPLEIHPDLKNVRGAVAMARRADPNSAGSQFYILRTDAAWLDGQYAVFGRVVSGMDVVDKIKAGTVIRKVTVTP